MTLRLGAAIALASLVVAWAGILPGSLCLADAELAAPVWGPYVTGTSETGSVINWRTYTPTWGIVQYGTKEHLSEHGGYQDLVTEPTLGELHQVRLARLQPDAEYRYRIWILGPEVAPGPIPLHDAHSLAAWLSNSGAISVEGGFRTLGADSFAFVVYGDSQEQTPWFTQLERHKLVADAIAQESDIAFVVHLGDLIYDADDMAGWNAFFEAAKAMLAKMTLYPVIGNHENNSPVYFDILGASPTYRFDAGSTSFLVLDTNSWADFEAQRSWLESELRSPARWNLVFYHHPAYSSDARNYGGWELSRRYWGDLLAQAGVLAAFSGHVHAYERYQVQGMHHFVVGTGGGALTDLATEAPPGIKNRLAKTLGYARVTVHPDSVIVDFIQVARISDDNRQVLEIFPTGIVFETVDLVASRDAAPAIPEGLFKVSPVSLRLELDRGGRQRFGMRITSSEDAQIHINTEGLPYSVQPSTLYIQGAEQSQRIELELFGDRSIPNGEYEGRLTFLRDAGNNVALGVKVKTTVLQTAGKGGLERALVENMPLVIVAVVILAANVGGYVLYRTYKARMNKAKDAEQMSETDKVG